LINSFTADEIIIPLQSAILAMQVWPSGRSVEKIKAD
jgi:hypothetical protein